MKPPVPHAIETTPIPPPSAAETADKSQVLLSVLEDLRSERERLDLEIEQRRQAEALFRATVESAPTAIVMIDAEGKMILVNAETEKLFAYERAELLGQPVEVLVPHRFRPNHPQLRAGFLAKPEARRMGEGRDLFGLRKDGSEFPIEIGLSPVMMDDSIYVLSTIADITARKHAEVDLRQLNESLELRVQERTGELNRTIEELNQAKLRAEAANEAKSLFLANMSHELRTPLSAVVGVAELMCDSSASPEQKEYLNIIRESSEALLAVINDILDFSKIEAGQLALERIDFDHAELVGAVMKSLGMRAQTKGLELTYRIAPDVPAILTGDPNRLRQMLMNLVGNAVKFTNEGDVQVNVEIVARSSDGQALSLHYSVADTGIGIPADKLQQVFEAFEQADTSTTRRFGGTGLGLAISSRLVSMMGGRIWVESIDGKGSTFHFTTSFAVPLQQPPPISRASENTLKGVSVLVVDDNQTNRRILMETLARWEMEPLETDSGLDALGILLEANRKGRPTRILLTDAHMPEIDGFELARRVKNDPRFSQTIVMMLSSGDQPGNIARCVELNLAGYLIKPISMSELLDTMLIALEADRPEPEAPAQPGAHAEAADPLASRQLRILLTEDSPVNQALAVRLLTKYGHHVDVASNGREAIDVWKLGRSDVILMDLQMPEIDGIQATRMIRSLERLTGKHTPIIAMTAHALDGDRERCLQAGMDGYVAKPFRKQDLFREIRQVLGTPEPPPEAVAEDAVIAAPERAGLVEWNTALAAAHGDEVILRRIVEISVQETDDLLGQMYDALDTGDPASLQRSAHTLKGHLHIFDVSVGEHLAFHIENTARDGSLEIGERMSKLEEVTGRVRTELVDFLEGRITLERCRDDKEV